MFDFIKKSFISTDGNYVSPFFCNQIKQFGYCEQSNLCQERHEICEIYDKNVINIPKKCFVSIKLLKINTASNFYGRIYKYSTAKDPTQESHWINLNNSFDTIKNELGNFVKSSKPKILYKYPKVGDLIMVETVDVELFRAVVIEINGWIIQKLKVKLIDIGSFVEVHSSKIYELPESLKNYSPAAIEICISSMKPIGSVLNWPISTTNITRSILEPAIVADVEFIGKVEFLMGSTLWVSWLFIEQCAICSHFICKLYKNPMLLPKELIDRKLAEESSQILNNLIDLYKSTNMWIENTEVEFDNKSLIDCMKYNISLFSADDQINDIVEEIKPQWAHLSIDIYHQVTVDYIENPRCFLIRNIKFLDRINILQKDINELFTKNNLRKLDGIKLGKVCLAKAPDNENYNRALIKEIFEDETVTVFYVDYGEFYKVHITSLMEIPSNIKSQLPFQVIECGLSGFNKIFENNLTDQNIIEYLMQLTDNEVYLKVLQSSSNSILTNGHFYNVVLFNDKININHEMALKFSDCVDNNQIQNILDAKYQYVEHISDDESIDDDDDILQAQYKLMKSLLKTTSEEIKEKPVNLSTEDNVLKTVPKSNLNHAIENNIQNLSKKKKKLYCLDCNRFPVVPRCFWHQDESWLYIKLNILSVINYHINHTINSISISVETNTVSYNFTAVLYAFIVEESFNCHVVFDGIHIKSKKLFQTKYKWPRLMKCSKKHKYITYNPEYVLEKSDKNVWAKLIGKYKMKAIGKPLNVDYYDDSENSSDSEEYSVFED
ncbi:putative ATP-dependent RNA helicase TDRD12 isoform X1 [Daktulosphaira vitifoliae]|uniref:putative ATP-dependent RNA helicase TDRD12 isoform X1 n=1 Tax=Daktulosphaira vitifoliae TaxID=58002 RepID=UPI0021AADA7B|nr:putative ATP-dependent RNA helicase TDRD12 isoform X1 [Daktulosphaira vitifoliae]XP_050529579.1 putative ATP-dependent RNA helicase TDRD12 isoform X1 [Daktulosphaira vitifoliae]